MKIRTEMLALGWMALVATGCGTILGDDYVISDGGLDATTVDAARTDARAADSARDTSQGTPRDATTEATSADRVTVDVPSAVDAGDHAADHATGPHDAGIDATKIDAGCASPGPGFETLGCPCAASGVGACTAVNPKLLLLCTGDTWMQNLPGCDQAQNCDPLDNGTCASLDPHCADAAVGQDVCGGDASVVQCGPNLVSDTPVKTCAQPSPVCVGGACACPSGGKLCGTGASEVCTNVAIDPANCATCGHSCPTGATCQGAICVCPGGGPSAQGACCKTGDVVCSFKCVDTLTDMENCGRCGKTCHVPTPECTAGVCAG